MQGSSPSRATNNFRKFKMNTKFVKVYKEFDKGWKYDIALVKSETDKEYKVTTIGGENLVISKSETIEIQFGNWIFNDGDLVDCDGQLAKVVKYDKKTHEYIITSFGQAARVSAQFLRKVEVIEIIGTELEV